MKKTCNIPLKGENILIQDRVHGNNQNNFFVSNR